MNTPESTLEEALRRLNRFHRRQIVKLAAVRMLWIGLLAVILLVYLDVVVQFRDTARLGLDLALALTLSTSAVLTFRWLRSATSRRRMLARLIERGHPDLQNEFVNAIDFEEKFQKKDLRAYSTDLMREEIDLALEKLERLKSLNVLKPPTLGKEERILAGLSAAVVALGILLGGWFSAVLPRYLDPYGDHPPYSPTRLVLKPFNAKVDYGENLVVHVKCEGKKPKDITLVLEDPASGEVFGESPLFESAEDLYYQTIENVRREMVYYARIEGGRSKRARIEISKIPKIESVTVRRQYPEYTNLPEDFNVLTDPLLKGYEGTTVTMTIASNRPLKSGSIQVAGKVYSLMPDGEKTVKGVFPLKKAGEFSASITDVEGIESKETFAGKIKILADEKPEVAIVSPGMDSFAIPSAKIAIVVEARDDLGVRSIDLFRNHNDSDDSRKSIYESLAKLTFVNGVETLDLGDLGLRPGDVIEYYATATDAYPSAPQTAASESFLLKIISREEFTKFKQGQMTAEDLQNKYDEILDQLDALRQDQERLQEETEAAERSLGESDAPQSEAEARRAGELARRQEELNERARELAQELNDETQKPAVFDIENEYKKALAEFAERLQNAGEHMKKSEGNLSESKSSQSSSQGKKAMARAAEEQEKALEQMRENIQEFEEGIQQANREIKQIDDLRQDVEAFKFLYLRQKSLERQARYHKETTEPDFDAKIRMKELSEEQMTVQEDLKELKDQLRQHADEVEEKYPEIASDAREIAQEIATRSIETIMHTASTRLNEGNGLAGHPKTVEARDEMKAMIEFCQPAQGKGESQCEERLKIVMSMEPGDTMGQLSQGSSPGGAPSSGMFGNMGKGSSGSGGSRTQFAVFGDDKFGKPSKEKSKMASVKRINSDVREGSNEPDPLAGNIEVLSSEKREDLEFTVEGDSPVMDRYRPLIEAYFERLAEEK